MPSTDLAALAAAQNGRKVLIAGGLGFLGSNLARVLATAGAKLILVDALLSGHGGLRHNLAGLEDQVDVRIGDVRDERLMAELVVGQDLIVNFCGQTSHLDSMRDPYRDLEHNCHTALVLLEAVRRSAPEATVVFASTRQLYGRPQYLPVDEEHPVDPVDVNGIHKWAGEAYHRLYRQVYGLRVSALRLTNTIGPRMRVRDARQTFLGLWIRQLLNGEQLQVFGDGTQVRDFTYVDDALRAFLLVASRDEALGQVYNLGDRRAVSLAELAELLIAIHGSGSYQIVPFPQDRLVIDIGDYRASAARIEASLGWTPSVSLEEALERTLAYFAEHGDHYWGAAEDDRA